MSRDSSHLTNWLPKPPKPTFLLYISYILKKLPFWRQHESMAKTVSSQQKQTDEARLLIKYLRKEIKNEQLVPTFMSVNFHTTEAWRNPHILEKVKTGGVDFAIRVVPAESYYGGNCLDVNRVVATLKGLNKTLKKSKNQQ